MKTLFSKGTKCLLVITMIVGLMTSYVFPVEAKENVDTTIYIDTDQVITQDFEGFGVQWDPSDLFDYTDEQWASFYEKAGFMKPNIMRVMLHDGDSYVTGFDENSNPIYDWDSVMMKRVYKILDFAEKNHVSIMLGEWRSISERGLLSYDEVGKTVKWDNPIWQRMIMDCLKHLIVDKGYTCIKYYNMVNEPNYYVRDNGGTDEASYEMWKKGITQLRQMMDDSDVEAIRNIKIVGPDVYDKQDAWIKQAKSEDMKDKIELTEIHRYAPKSEVESGLIEQKLRGWKELAEKMDPRVKEEGFAIGEMGLSGTGPGDCQLNARYYEYGVDIFDYALQATRAGLKFGSVWGFEDSMHVQHNDIVSTFKDKYGPEAKTEEGRAYKVHTPTGDPSIDNDIKIWGFWNELGEEMAKQNEEAGVTNRANTVKASDEQLKPWYYTWSMFCRYFPAGMQILETTESGVDQVRATSGILPQGDKADISIAVVNTSSRQKTVRLNVPNVKSLADLNQYFYYDGEIDGKTRALNEKGQLLPYGTIENADLSQGVDVTLPANSCMILTTLGYERESHPLSLTTGRLPQVEKIKISEESQAQELSVGKSYQMVSQFTPSISTADVEWKITDYFGNPSSLATIDSKGVLTVNKPGQFNVVGSVKGHPEINDTITLMATSTTVLVEKFDSLEEPSVGEYINVVKDGNPGNFNGIQTVKRDDTTQPQANIIYQADGIYGFAFDVFSQRSLLGETDNFMVEVSTDKVSWDKVECQYTVEGQLSSSWYQITVTDKNLDTSKDYKYLRITLQSLNGYKAYDPQYGGGTIQYGEKCVSQIKIDNQEKFIVKGETLEFTGSILPAVADQEIEWSVVDEKGKVTTMASMKDNVLTAHEVGKVVVIAEPKDHSMSRYYPIDIVGAYLEDDIVNFDNMYSYGSFVYEGASSRFDDKTILKRTSDTAQTLVYSYSQIQMGSIEIYKNGTLTSDQIDIYASKDGIHYDLLDKTIENTGFASPSNTEYKKYEVTALTNSKEYNFIKFEMKNDSSVYCPMVGKTKIIYNPLDDAKVISLNAVNQPLSLNVGDQKKLDIKVAPFDSQAHLTYTSENPAIASVDENGQVTAHEIGSTYIVIKDHEVYTKCIVNVYENLALNKTVEASGVYGSDVIEFVNDGNYSTRWASQRNDNQYMIVDLGEVMTIDTIKIFWESARAKSYSIDVAKDDKVFETLETFTDMPADSLNDVITFEPIEARYIKMQGIKTETKYGYSIYEFEVYNNHKVKNVESISFQEEAIELYVGQEYPLEITVLPKDATYRLPLLTTLQTNTIHIQDNVVKATGVGEAIIIAQADGKTTELKINVVKENAQKFADELSTLEIENGRIIFPEHEGYQYSIDKTSLEKVVGKDGRVHQPVKGVSVDVVVKVEGPDKVAYSKTITLVIDGDSSDYDQLQKLLKTIDKLDKNIYTSAKYKKLIAEAQSIKTMLKQDVLLVEEVKEAKERLQKALDDLIHIDSDDINDEDKTVKTGDQSQMKIFALLCFVALSCMILLSRNKKHKKEIE